MRDAESLVESIRLRPGMYIGEPHPQALLWEAVANCVDTVLGGRPVHVEIVLHSDGSVSVEDDGPGISLSLETLFTVGHTTPTADGHAPHVHLTNPGLGLAVIGALCERVEVETSDGEARCRQSFGRGEARCPLEREAAPGPSGTRIQFWPDPDVFPSGRWDPTAVRERLRELAAFSPGLSFRIQPAVEALGPNRGLADLLPPLAMDTPNYGPIEGAGRYGAASCAFVLRLGGRRHSPELRSYCNLKRTTEGAHVAAFEAAVGQAFARVLTDLPGDAYRQAYERVGGDAQCRGYYPVGSRRTCRACSRRSRRRELPSAPISGAAVGVHSQAIDSAGIISVLMHRRESRTGTTCCAFAPRLV